MNQRFFLALILTAGVVLLTPVIFPGMRRVPPPPVTAADTSQRAPAATGAPVTAERAQTNTAPVATQARVDTTVINTPKAQLRLSSAGGSLIGAQLRDYPRLGGDSTPVELARPNEALLRFRIVAGRDTIRLDTAALSREAQATPNEYVFRGTVRDLSVAVRWSFAPDTYRVKVSDTEEPVGYVSRVEVHAEGPGANGFLLVDLPPGFQTSERDSMTDYQHLAYSYKLTKGSSDLLRFGKLSPGASKLQPGPLDWAAAKSKYFLVGILAPNEAASFAELQVTGGTRTGRLATNGHATVVVPLRNGSASFEVYAGPISFQRMRAMHSEFETANAYGGWMQGIVQPFATIVIRLLLAVKKFLHLPYGWTLIAFGVLIRIVLWPLNQMAMRSSLRMQRVQPELAAAQKKYANNPEKQREEIMRIYRDHGMSPFSALSGCLPMLIPMPVLFALFFVFQNTIEFRGVSFWWMADISQYDPLFIIPIVMAVSMFVLSWIGTRNAPPNPQAKMMMYFLPALMLVFLYKFAAGLNLYYAAQNLAAIPQQWMISNERAKIAATKT